MTYQEQLKSPKWQKKRLEILTRDNFTCLSCKSTEKQLHVHHGYYEKNKMLWEYENESLYTLCFTCHEVIQMHVSDIKLMIGTIKDVSKMCLISEIVCQLIDYSENSKENIIHFFNAYHELT